MDLKNTKRCFIALNLPLGAINEIRNIQKLIKGKNLFIGKFTELENLHLTLKFLGEITENKVNEVKERLKDISFRTFEGKLRDVGVFSESFVKIIWVELTGNVFELQKQIDEKLKEFYEPEKRFMSHITIARVKKSNDKNKLIDVLKNIKPKKIKFKINNFYLMESDLRSEKPVYKVIERYNLER